MSFKHESWGRKLFLAINTAIMLAVVILCLYPFIYVAALSLSEKSAVLNREVWLLPVKLNLESYKVVLNHPNFLMGYKNTILYTVTGTLFTLFMTTIAAYPLSKKFLPGRKFIMKAIIFTMFFGAGLIPSYLLVRGLGLRNSIGAILLPAAISQYNMILMITFFRGIPDSLEESAAIDGLNPIQILARIVLPLSKPVLATIALYNMVYFWNDWFAAMIFLDKIELQPITLFLRNIVMGAELAVKTGDVASIKSASRYTSTTLRATTIMLTTLPILFSYPFLQKYFIKGVLIGSVKG